MKLNLPENKTKFIFDWLFIIGTLTLIGLYGYKTGFHNGQIKQCDELGMYKLTSGECVIKEVYDEKLQSLGYDESLRESTYKYMGEKNRSLELYAFN